MWVNVAFTSVFARFVDIEPEEFERVTAETYLGFVTGTAQKRSDQEHHEREPDGENQAGQEPAVPLLVADSLDSSSRITTDSFADRSRGPPAQANRRLSRVSSRSQR